MFELIRSEICGATINNDLQKQLSAEKYKKLFLLSREHDLSHIVASALSRIGLLGEDEVSSAFNQELMRAVHRDSQREYAINLTNNLLEQAQIPHINLKGSVICHMYPQSWMRTSCDIDVLIHNPDFALVEKVLCENEYIRLEDSSTHDYNFMSPNKFHIEVHYTLKQGSKKTSTDELLDTVWESYVIPVENCKYRYNLTNEMFIIYHLAHMARHLLHGGCGVRPFIDLWLIEKKYQINTTNLDALLKKCNLKALYDVSLELSKVWLEDKNHNQLTEQLEQYILIGGVYGSSTNAARVKAAKGESKVRSFFNLMFLPKKNLEVLYPNLKKHPILLPFYQVKRWFKWLNKKKRNNAKQIIKERNNVSVEQKKETEDLLNQLGLI